MNNIFVSNPLFILKIIYYMIIVMWDLDYWKFFQIYGKNYWMNNKKWNHNISVLWNGYLPIIPYQF